jgi:NitT/TauT family transport system permease protein
MRRQYSTCDLAKYLFKKTRCKSESDDMGIAETGAGRTYKTRQDVSKIRRWLIQSISWSTLRVPLSLIISVIIWHILTTYKLLIFSRVPTPLAVLKEGIVYVPTADYWQNVFATNARVFSGFLAACVAGIPLGLAMGYKRVFNDFAFPVFEILRPCPPMAWIPLSSIIFPTMELSVLFLGFIGAFFPIVVNTHQGVMTIPKGYRYAALSLGASPHRIFSRIILPGAMPAIFTGMAVGMGMTWEMIAAAEMVAAGEGLGYMVWDAYWLMVDSRIVLGMISLGVCGYIYSAAVRTLGKKLMPWR